jgi:hypothetical protein
VVAPVQHHADIPILDGKFFKRLDEPRTRVGVRLAGYAPATNLTLEKGKRWDASPLTVIVAPHECIGRRRTGRILWRSSTTH